jgi:hypothetical protein
VVVAAVLTPSRHRKQSGSGDTRASRPYSISTRCAIRPPGEADSRDSAHPDHRENRMNGRGGRCPARRVPLLEREPRR